VDNIPSWAQNGEDQLLWKLFNKPKGFFIDVGAADGIRFSNTYLFEQRGWEGILIEPNPKSYEELQQNRSSPAVECVVTDQDNVEKEFYLSDYGGLSSLHVDRPEQLPSLAQWYVNWRSIKRLSRTLSSILEEHRISLPIDFVSLDVEGAELAALKGFDLKKWMPRVLVVEGQPSERDENEVRAYLVNHGYILCTWISNNFFYCRLQTDIRRIQELNK